MGLALMMGPNPFVLIWPHNPLECTGGGIQGEGQEVPGLPATAFLGQD